MAEETKPRFHYPVSREFTGRLQYRINGASRVSIAQLGDVLRGQVVAVKNKQLAVGLVLTREFSHVASDTPLGQPEKYRASHVVEGQSGSRPTGAEAGTQMPSDATQGDGSMVPPVREE